MSKYIMALDAGTTSNRAIIFDKNGQVIAKAQKEFTQIFPKPGWVEHDPTEIWSTQLGVATEAMAKLNIEAKDLAATGITNQRETTIIWDKNTGLPVYNAIVWQCRRTADMTDSLRDKGLAEFFRKKTGLVLDPYFSATKIRWILDNIEDGQKRAEKGDLLFGTVDTWLIWKLTKGRVHVTDPSNASRTMLYNIHQNKWDQEILDLLNIPRSILPEIKNTSEVYGFTSEDYFGGKIAIGSCCGDQQAALFGQTCFEKGDAKNTYGTGAFLLMNTGENPIDTEKGLITTLAWMIDGKPTYALEGSIFVAGSSVQWLRDSLRIIDSAQDSEYMATRVDDTDGVYFVPAFTGLGAPYWDPYARGALVGLTRGTNKYHIVRATLESQAYLSNDVLEIMAKEAGLKINSIKVDGGASANNFLMGFQADISQHEVERPKVLETTALGASYLAGLAVGFWKDLDDIKNNWILDQRYKPKMGMDERNNKYSKWKEAIKRSLNWAKEN